MSWIIGPKSTEKISIVLESLKNKRLTIANEYFDANMDHYHPVMGKAETYRDISQTDMNLLSSNLEILNFNPSYLKVVDDIITKQPYLNLAFGKTAPFKIFVDILEKEPDAVNEFRTAINIISTSTPWLWQNFKLVIQAISPLSINGHVRHTGGSSDYNLLGNIFVTLNLKPLNIEQLAISLVHELGHNCLMVYQSGQAPIHEADYYKHVYSGVRKSLRPSMGSFHALIALSYMYSLCLGASTNLKLTKVQNSYFLSKAIEFKHDLIDSLDALKKIKLNEIGVVIYKEVFNFVMNS